MLSLQDYTHTRCTTVGIQTQAALLQDYTNTYNHFTETQNSITVEIHIRVVSL
jgi:hypothetical protein